MGERGRSYAPLAARLRSATRPGAPSAPVPTRVSSAAGELLSLRVTDADSSFLYPYALRGSAARPLAGRAALTAR